MNKNISTKFFKKLINKNFVQRLIAHIFCYYNNFYKIFEVIIFKKISFSFLLKKFRKWHFNVLSWHVSYEKEREQKEIFNFYVIF